MKKRIYVLALLTLCSLAVLGLTACTGGTCPNTIERSAYQKPAKDAEVALLIGTFETVDIKGEAVTDSIFAQSELTMVNVWATFCGPCIKEMPDLASISKSYDTAQFQIVGIVSDVNAPNDKTALSIIEETGADYKHLLISSEMMSGFIGTVQLVPTTVFLDKDGKQVGQTYAGSKSKAQWQKIIEDAIKDIA